MSFALAAVAMAAGVLIPYLVGRTVDQIREGETNLLPLAVAIAGAGVLRLFFSVAPAGRRAGLAGRRVRPATGCTRTCSRSSSASSTGSRRGQLMSRSTVDLQAVRFFLGYGLVFILQSALTILIAAGVMLAVNPRLAAVALAPVPFVVARSPARYGRLNLGPRRRRSSSA